MLCAKMTTATRQQDTLDVFILTLDNTDFVDWTNCG